MRSFLVVALAVPSLPAVAPAQVFTTVSGYVTVVKPSGDFDLEGAHIRLTPSTRFKSRDSLSQTSKTTPATRRTSFYLGETLDATGQLDLASQTVTATNIVFVHSLPASVSGLAIIDFIPAAASQFATERTLRADGYLLHITKDTKLKFAAPLKSLADISTNQWIDYSGVQQPDGTILLSYARIGPNRIGKSEDRIRNQTEYDPTIIPDNANQRSMINQFIRVDLKQLPPTHDRQLQDRVQRIGVSLIPAFQRALPNSDPTKIHFRFQVVEPSTPRFKDFISMPSGVVPISRSAVNRMQNDDQLAAILADSIAETIEKEVVRSAAADTTKRVSSDAAVGSLFLLWPAGVAGGLLTEHLASQTIEKTVEQSARVSLCLLHDAGYDITQAPLAWWLLAPKKPKPLDKVPLPPRAISLYQSLGTTWRPAESPGSGSFGTGQR